MINPIQQQTCNSQSFNSLSGSKFLNKSKKENAKKIVKHSKELTKQITSEKKLELSFWQKIKTAWNLVNKLQ